MKLHYEILDQKRINILPTLSKFKDVFYLAGGTGLALQIGHRDSVDFDFFVNKNINTQNLYNQIRDVFVGHKIEKVQEEKDTIGIIVDEELKISFMSYLYPVVDSFVQDEYLNIASIRDIACMKLSAITGRSVLKDYVDIYFILQRYSLKSILEFLTTKMPDQDYNLVLKCLIYFEDVAQEKIIFKNGADVTFEKIKTFLISEAKKIYKEV